MLFESFLGDKQSIEAGRCILANTVVNHNPAATGLTVNLFIGAHKVHRIAKKMMRFTG